MKCLIIAAFLLSGCVTPDQWSPSDHRRSMLSCRTMCGKHRVKGYDPMTAECTCHKSIKELILED